MDLGSVIFGIISLACFIVPIIYLQGKKNKEKKEFLKYFMKLAEQQQLIITEHDFWNHSYAIGIDTQKNKLFYLKKQEGKDQQVLIDLREVERCTIHNSNRTVNNNKIIDSIDLCFTFRNKKPQKTLSFYNREESLSVNEEHQFSEKWNTLINSRLKEQPQGKSDLELESDSLALA